MDSVKHASTPQPFFSKDCKVYALTLYIYNACASVTWGYDIVRKRNEEERERQSLERSLEPLEHLELLEPLNLSRLSLGARQKPNKPLGEYGGRCPCCYASALVLLERALNAQTERLCTTFIMKVTILIKAINRKNRFALHVADL